VAVQVSDLENGSWESDRKFVVELDGARKAVQYERVSFLNYVVHIEANFPHGSSCLFLHTKESFFDV
jgi:hypothetical protein